MTKEKQFGAKVKKLYFACSQLSQNEQLLLIEKSDYSSEVKQKVLNLLKYSGDIDDYISQTVLYSAQQNLNENSLASGQVIDKYQLQSHLGDGGQGEVWLAKRVDGEFEHQAAIKFIKRLANDKEITRFQNERTLLASLKHENIATLLDGGSYQGRLYMVMEWVDGMPLYDFIATKKVNLTTHLRYFIDICHAVSYAHSKGIIHRDIKPSNILITHHGKIKLLDFGIAKPLSAKDTIKKNDIMLTMAYASPEQINGMPITISTDIYALGLILYEMLTRKKAQGYQTNSAKEYIHHISDITPQAPSQQLGADQHHLKRRLKGDLDNLVMMAIRKEPSRRYKHVDDLIDDIENYLASRPLKASGDGYGYLISKFVRRNPLTVFMGTGIFLLLILLPVIMYNNNIRLTKERDKTHQKMLIASQTTQFLTTLFKSASPLGTNGRQISLKEILQQGERQLKNNLNQKPEVLAPLSMVLASVNYHTNDIQKSISYYKNSALLYQQLNDKNHQLEALGQLAIMLYRNDQIQASDETFSQADTLSHEKDINPLYFAWHQLRKSTVLNEKNETRKAIQLANKSLNIIHKYGIKNPDIEGRIYSELGEAYKYSNPEKSLNYNTLSLKLVAQEVGKIHPYYHNRLNSRAVRLMRLNRNAEAKKVLEQSLSIAEQLYSKHHPGYAMVVGEFGNYHHNLGEFDQAMHYYQLAKQIYADLYGTSSYDYARMINNIAYLYEDMENYPQAEKLYKESIQIRKQQSPNNHYRIASAQANLARLLSKTGQYQQSELILTDLIPVFNKKNKNPLYNDITTMANTFQQGQNKAHCKQGMQLLNKLAPELKKESNKSWRRMSAELWISKMLDACQQFEKSQQWYNSAKKISESIYTAGSRGQLIVNQYSHSQ
ncbi:MAG: protein kinase domain-containing protein [bacterium]